MENEKRELGDVFLQCGGRAVEKSNNVNRLCLMSKKCENFTKQIFTLFARHA